MNNKLLTLIILLLILLLMTSCADTLGMGFNATKLLESEMNNMIEEFSTTMDFDKGAYLFTNESNSICYLYITTGSIEQGESVFYIDGLTISTEGTDLEIKYKEVQLDSFDESIDSYNNLYRIKMNKNYDTIRIKKNDKETYFNSIIVID